MSLNDTATYDYDVNLVGNGMLVLIALAILLPIVTEIYFRVTEYLEDRK